MRPHFLGEGGIGGGVILLMPLWGFRDIQLVTPLTLIMVQWNMEKMSCSPRGPFFTILGGLCYNLLTCMILMYQLNDISSFTRQKLVHDSKP